jgi:hypothetical protein
MMIVLPETTKTATALNVHGENGVWMKPKSLGNNKDGIFNKIEYNEKRNCQRWHFKGSIWLTNFNKTDLMGAQTSNYCLGGMCFKSYTFFKSQTILLLRINSEGWDFSCAGDPEGLRTVTPQTLGNLA